MNNWKLAIGKHKDFDIYTEIDTKTGKKIYRFEVQYFGRYSATSEEDIKNKIKEVKKRVANRISENEKYDRKHLHEEIKNEQEVRAMLKRIRNYKNKILTDLAYNPTSAQEKRMQRQMILDLLEKGYTMEEVANETGSSLATIARHKHLYEEKKYLKRNGKWYTINNN